MIQWGEIRDKYRDEHRDEHRDTCALQQTERAEERGTLSLSADDELSESVSEKGGKRKERE